MWDPKSCQATALKQYAQQIKVVILAYHLKLGSRIVNVSAV